MKKLARATLGLLACLGLVFVAQPAFAAVSDPGILSTINPTGGTSSSDGLRFEIAFGQMQVIRNGSGQFYGANDSPNPSDPEQLSNYFVVAFDDSGTLSFVGDSYDLPNSEPWDSFTSEATLTDSDRSGTVINHLTQGSGSNEINLDVTYTYVYPNDYINVDVALTLGNALTAIPHKIYWYTDSVLGGDDTGTQSEGITPSGKTMVGVTDVNHTMVEAYRSTDSALASWAGLYVCPYSVGSLPGDCSSETTGAYLLDFDSFPDAVSPNTLDNGFGVSSTDLAISEFNDGFNFDLVFVSCDTVRTDSDIAAGFCAEKPALPDTGAPRPVVGLLAAGLVAIGLAMLAWRRMRGGVRRRG